MNLQFYHENISGLRSFCAIMIINAITQWNVSNESTLLHIETYFLQHKTSAIGFYQKYSLALHFSKLKNNNFDSKK